MLASFAVIYALVLIGSFAGICTIFGTRVLLRNRSVRKFVRSMKQRSEIAQERGGLSSSGESPTKENRNCRKSATDFQEMRLLLRRAEKAEVQKKYDEAEKYYIQALTILPDAVEIQAQLARLYLRTEREQKAVALYEKLLQENDDISYFANLGLAYYKLGQFGKSCVAYEAAFSRDANNPERAASLGRACMAARRYDRAAPLLEKACDRLTRDTELLSLLAECYSHLQDLEHARKTYQKINKLEPYNEDVKKKLEELAVV